MLEPLLPPGLELDTYDGDAWISIISIQSQYITFSFLAANAISDFIFRGERPDLC
ncbi:DUF2071 domain-containing protein [Lentibacillus sp. CBA3610]|uniref:DUF2071 domain-containing protein n=1 Tax=Lentibacillus sp. CBA3610 TaxID=2518176 RepID=UPI0020D22338|nr:DUF2071 domain-containing protein [Lentibacillus sp. CBA3610]